MTTAAKDQFILGALGLVPQNLLSRAVGVAAHARLPKPLAQLSIRAFARAYGIDLTESAEPVSAYDSIGDFFTRRLRTGALPIDRRPGLAVSPADGRLFNGGKLTGGTLIQAKGRRYRVDDLLRNSREADRFRNGSWITVYLSPRDYHRVHHPAEGTVTAARYVPGHLWPVNASGVANIDDLFCVNERLITYVDAPIGPVAVVMVGATSVGHITVAYDRQIETNRGGTGMLHTFDPPVRVARGDELGVFHLGSTAVVLFGDPDVRIEPFEPHQPVRMGEVVARK